MYFTYSPPYERLIIHSIKVHRGDDIIDKTRTSKMSVLQREENLESNVYSGDKTVNVIMNDIRANDIVEYDFSVIGDNPIFDNKFLYTFYLNGYYPYKEINFRFVKPKNIKLNINYKNHFSPPVIETSGDKEILTWNVKETKGLKTEAGAPDWDDPYFKVELSEYFSWEDVVKWGMKVFKQSSATKFTDYSKIKALSELKTDEEKVIGALDFVQNEIRYFGIEIGTNSHKPKNPLNILKDGYGDCKDKTVLLCEILKSMNIKAYPVLVHTESRFGLINSISSPGQFNHVITMVSLNNKNYYLDPTISNQGGGLGYVYVPNYGYGLVLKDSVSSLTYLSSKRNSDIKLKENYTINDISGKASLEVKTFYTGYDADLIRSKFANSNIKEIQDKYKEFYTSKYTNIDVIGHLIFKDDKEVNLFTSTENYKIKRVWEENSDNVLRMDLSGHFVKEALDDINITLETRKSPLNLSYPDKRVHVIEVSLPEDWSIQYKTNTISNRYIWYNKKITYAARKLKITYTLHLLRPQVEPQDYPSFKDDIEKIYDDIGYQITWNQKLSLNTKDSNVNWLVLILAVLFFVLVGLLAFYLYRKFTANPGTEVPMRLGGWLVLPLIGLFINLFLIFSSFFTNSYFDKSVWLARTDQTSEDYLPGFSAMLIFELLVNICIFIYTLLIFVLALKYNRNVPKLFIIYYIAYFAAAIGDDVLAIVVLDQKDYYGLTKDIFRYSITCAIWIPYFLVSKRVKETFIS